jgi:hypothetical protein
LDIKNFGCNIVEPKRFGNVNRVQTLTQKMEILNNIAFYANTNELAQYDFISSKFVKDENDKYIIIEKLSNNCVIRSANESDSFYFTKEKIENLKNQYVWNEFFIYNIDCISFVQKYKLGIISEQAHENYIIKDFDYIINQKEEEEENDEYERNSYFEQRSYEYAYGND